MGKSLQFESSSPVPIITDLVAFGAHQLGVGGVALWGGETQRGCVLNKWKTWAISTEIGGAQLQLLRGLEVCAMRGARQGQHLLGSGGGVSR